MTYDYHGAPELFLEPRIEWYGKARRGKYHRPEKDWVQRGRAVCGADIARAGWMMTNPSAENPRLCAHCKQRSLPR